MGKFAEKIRALEREQRRLTTEQGRTARGNARRAVLGLLKDIRRAMDEEYPVIAKEKKASKPRRAAKPPKNWIKLDLERFTGGGEKAAFITKCATEGVRLRKFKRYLPAENARIEKRKHVWELYAPLWAVACFHDHQKFQLCKKSISERRVVEAAYLLKGTHG